MSGFWPKQKSDHVNNWRDKKETKNIDAKFHNNQDKNQSNDQNHHNRPIVKNRNRLKSSNEERYRHSEHFNQRPIIKKYEFRPDDFPNLSEDYIVKQTNIQDNNYMQKCMIINQEEKESKKHIIDVDDAKFWNGCIWIGPMFMKADKPSKMWQNYLINASQNSSTIIIPSTNKYYSRDNHTWFPSWKETFTEEQWDNMQYQEDQEIANKVMNHLVEKHEEELTDAYELYYETGEMNMCLQAHLEHVEHEKYVQKIDEEWLNIDTQEEENEDEYLSDTSE
jgi:hypothetical protein